MEAERATFYSAADDRHRTMRMREERNWARPEHASGRACRRGRPLRGLPVGLTAALRQPGESKASDNQRENPVHSPSLPGAASTASKMPCAGSTSGVHLREDCSPANRGDCNSRFKNVWWLTTARSDIS